VESLRQEKPAKATDAQIRAMLHRFRLAFPQWAMGRDRRDIDSSYTLYCERLRSLEADLLQQACDDLLDQAKHFPCIAEIIESCRAIRVRQKQRERERPWWEKTPPELSEARRAGGLALLEALQTQESDHAHKH
jgi:hypothetical protein